MGFAFVSTSSFTSVCIFELLSSGFVLFRFFGFLLFVLLKDMGKETTEAVMHASRADIDKVILN